MEDGTVVWGHYECSQCNEVTSAQPGADGGVHCSHCGVGHTNEPYIFNEDSNGEMIFNRSDISKTKKTAERGNSGQKIECPYCVTDAFNIDDHCSNCGANLVEARPTPPPRREHVPTPPVRNNNGRNGIIGTLAAATVGGIGYGVWWYFFDEEEIIGHASGASWIHRQQVDRFTKTTRRDWRHNFSPSEPVMPENGVGENSGAFNVRECRSEFYENERYVCGSENYDVEEAYEEPYETEETYQEAHQIPYEGTETVEVPYEETYEESEWVDNGNGSRTKRTVTKTRTRYRSETRNVTKYRTEYETRTRTVTKTRTKYRTVTKTRDVYCTRPIYKNKCTYDTYEWNRISTLETKASDFADSAENPMSWPEFELGQLDRRSRQGVYQVRIEYTHDEQVKNYQIDINGIEEFKTWKRGEKVKMWVNRAGSVLRYERMGSI